MTQFEKFQKEFKKYQKTFGLNGYNIYFKEEPLSDCYGQIVVNHQDHVATVKLNSNPQKNDWKVRPVTQTAKHEACHLLLSRLEDCARDRFTSESNISEAVEELAFKLENLIP